MCETKVCHHCGRELPVTLFCKRTASPDGLQMICKPCMNELNRIRKQRKKDEAFQFAKDVKEAADSAPVGAVTITTKDGRTLRRVDENCKPLSEFSPRELLEELKRRGYVWENMWYKTHVEYSKI